MLKHSDLHEFLKDNNDPSQFSLCSTIDKLAKYLNSHITLIDNSGFIIYQKFRGSGPSNVANFFKTEKVQKLQSHELLYTKKLNNIVPIWVKGHSLGALIVEKENLNNMEKALLEMASGIISIHMR